MRRVAWVLLSLVLLVGSAQAVTLEVWRSASNEAIRVQQEVIEAFTAETGIEVVITPILGDAVGGGDLWSKTLLAMATGDTPDIVVSGSEWPPEFGIRGGLIDLRERWPQEFDALASRLFPGVMLSVDYHGTGYGIMESFGFTQTYYRTDLYAEMGLEYPTTWDDVRAQLPRLQSRGRNIGTSAWYILPNWFGVSIFTWQHGGRVISEDRLSSGLDSPQAIRGFIELMELFTEHGAPKETVPIQGFVDGVMPLMVGVSWNYTTLQHAFPQLQGKWGMGLLPGTPRDGIIDHTAYLGGNPMSIFTGSKHQEEAWTFIKWWLQPHVQTEYANRLWREVTGAMYLPANMEAFNQVDLFEDGHREYFYEQARQCRAPVFALGSVPAKRYINNAAMSVVLTGQNPEEAIRYAAREMTSEIQRKQVEFARFINRLVK